MSYISDKYKIPHEVVVQMSRDGILDWRVNVLYEFWTLYKDVLEQNLDRGIKYPRKEAREEVMLHFKLTSERNFYRWLKASKKFFAKQMSVN